MFLSLVGSRQRITSDATHGLQAQDQSSGHPGSPSRGRQSIALIAHDNSGSDVQDRSSQARTSPGRGRAPAAEAKPASLSRKAFLKSTLPPLNFDSGRELEARSQTIGRLGSQRALGPLLEQVGPLLGTEGELCGQILADLGRTKLFQKLLLDDEAASVLSKCLERHLSGKSEQNSLVAEEYSSELGLPQPRQRSTSGDEHTVSDLEDEPTVATSGHMNTALPPREPLPWLPDATYGGLRQRCFVLFDDTEASLGGKLLGIVVMLTIILSTAAFVLESVPELRERPPECAELRASRARLTPEACEPRPMEVFSHLEIFCIAIFTVDYLVRVATVHSTTKKGPTRTTLAYMRQPLAIVDVLAILPFYIDAVVGGGISVLAKVLRLCRILRLLKLAGRSPMVRMYGEVLMMSGQPLLILIFFNIIIVTLFSCMIYYAEGQQYSVDEKFLAAFPTGVYVRPTLGMTDIEPSPFRSVPYGLWWVAVTVTTVGYGDIAPTSWLGQVIGVCCFYVGIIILAMPISILGQNFHIVYERRIAINRRAAVMIADPPARRANRSVRNTTESLDATRIANSRARVSTRDSFLPVASSWRKRMFLLLEDPTCCIISKWLSAAIMLVIFVSTITLILESMPELRETPVECLAAERPTVENCEPVPEVALYYIEAGSVAIFTADFFIRIALVHSVRPQECGLPPGEYGPLKLTAAYARQLLNLIDFFSIMPFYAELAGLGSGGASVLRVLRLVRIFRLLKYPKLRGCAEMFIDVATDAAPALFILLFMSSLACVFFSSCIWIAEGQQYSVEDEWLEQYPEGVYVRPTCDGHAMEVSPFFSIPISFWWFFTTAATVGYGDMYPTTTEGRIIAVFVFCTGIILLAMPITIVGGSFSKYYEKWMAEFGDENGKGGEEPDLRDEIPQLEKMSETMSDPSVAAPNDKRVVAWAS